MAMFIGGQLSATLESGLGPAIGTGPLHGHGVPHIDMKDFPFLESANQGKGEIPKSDGINESSQGEEAVDYTELIEREAFVGEYLFDTIIEGITDQFTDYIGTEDRTNYVDAFYEQLHASHKLIDSDDGEEHPVERKEALGKILDKFVATMQELFEKRLSITITDLEAGEVNNDELEQIFHQLYEFFILNARKNFKVVIAADINHKMKNPIDDDREYYKTIREMLRHYSPLVTAIGPMEFIWYAELGADPEEAFGPVHKLFDDGKVSGNFLRRYSPKLYQYEEFEVEVIQHIVMVQEVKEEILNGGNE